MRGSSRRLPEPGRHCRVSMRVALVATVFATFAASGRAQTVDGSGALIGDWIRIEHDADDARRTEAIERSTAELPALIRGIARGLMSRSTRPARRYAIRAAEPGLSIRADDEAPVVARLDGKPDPDPSADVWSRALSDGFEQIWRKDESTHGRTRWRLLPDPPQLVVGTRVEDGRFSAPLVFETRYRRLAAIGGPAARP